MKNSRQAGNRTENTVAEMLEKFGYAVWKSRGSRGTADLVAFEKDGWWTGHPMHTPLCPLVVQVGTQAKPITATLRELQEAPRPIGSLCLVARKTKLKNGRVKWLFSTEHGKFNSLSEALEVR